jgi:hypothetical protein
MAVTLQRAIIQDVSELEPVDFVTKEGMIYLRRGRPYWMESGWGAPISRACLISLAAAGPMGLPSSCFRNT